MVGEKTVIGDPKVNFFDSHIRSLAVARALRQGVHPRIVWSNFFQ